ncbi:cobalamin-binding domain-containing protein, partial [Candidatus Sumerlaeota bacterium]|nr:cobalamin-binding domain-containing protein [Candidatus Sumerlaeota bacterium]
MNKSPLKILLVEPDYPNKFPPLGLLKIGTYHKQRGDIVVFVKGLIKKEQRLCLDRVYISTLFSFYHEKTINTIL